MDIETVKLWIWRIGTVGAVVWLANTFQRVP